MTDLFTPQFGEFGGAYVPEALTAALVELDAELTRALADPEFTDRLHGLHATSIVIDDSGAAEYPVTVKLAHLENLAETGETSTLRAKYVIGADGAHSTVRRGRTGAPSVRRWWMKAGCASPA